jgi:hypothetical protein
MVPEALVAEDLAETIAEFDRSAEVICARTNDAAAAALKALGTVEIAFVASTPSGFIGSALHADIVQRGGRVVLMGVEAECAGPTGLFDVLAQPFDTDTVMLRLRSGPRAG